LRGNECHSSPSLMFGMMCLLLLSLSLWFVAVCGRAVLVRDAHVH
jgi:hypothetical protein